MEEQNQVKWYFKTGSLIIAFLALGPLVLPLIWTNPRFNKRNKIVISSIVIIISILLIIMTAKTIKSAADYYQELQKI